MVQIIKDLKQKGYINIVFNNGLGDNFYTGIKENYITLKGIEYFEKINTAKYNSRAK